MSKRWYIGNSLSPEINSLANAKKNEDEKGNNLLEPESDIGHVGSLLNSQSLKSVPSLSSFTRIGKVSVYLSSLTYLLHIESSFPVIDYTGRTRGLLHLRITPTHVGDRRVALFDAHDRVTTAKKESIPRAAEPTRPRGLNEKTLDSYIDCTLVLQVEVLSASGLPIGPEGVAQVTFSLAPHVATGTISVMAIDGTPQYPIFKSSYEYPVCVTPSLLGWIKGGVAEFQVFTSNLVDQTTDQDETIAESPRSSSCYTSLTPRETEAKSLLRKQTDFELKIENLRNGLTQARKENMLQGNGNR